MSTTALPLDPRPLQVTGRLSHKIIPVPSSPPPHLFLFLLEIRSSCLAQADPKLLGSSNPASASGIAGTTGSDAGHRVVSNPRQRSLASLES
jgi:hypothetical protein